MARLLALNSTGSVMSVKSTVSRKNTMPSVMSGCQLNIRPIRNSGQDRFEPILTVGTTAVLSTSGLYASRCWSAWPVSCAATPSAVSEVESATPWDRRSVRVEGS